MLFFDTRKAARTFATKSDNYKVIDNDTTAKKRWGVKVL